jgi:hypothetical protein
MGGETNPHDPGFPDPFHWTISKAAAPLSDAVAVVTEYVAEPTTPVVLLPVV